MLNNTSINTRMFGFDHTHGHTYADSTYKSKHDGLIGIAPYTADSKHVSDSFLW
jgi:hypothetical protein